MKTYLRASWLDLALPAVAVNRRERIVGFIIGAVAAAVVPIAVWLLVVVISGGVN